MRPPQTGDKGYLGVGGKGPIWQGVSRLTLILIAILKVFIKKTYLCITAIISFQDFKNTSRDLHTKVHMATVTDGKERK